MGPTGIRAEEIVYPRHVGQRNGKYVVETEPGHQVLCTEDEWLELKDPGAAPLRRFQNALEAIEATSSVVILSKEEGENAIERLYRIAEKLETLIPVADPKEAKPPKEKATATAK